MEDAKCILCGHDAQRNVFSDAPDPTKVAGGYRYICPECGLYAINDYEYNWIERWATENQKRILSEYVKKNPDKEGKFRVVRWDEIKKILGLPSKEKQ